MTADCAPNHGYEWLDGAARFSLWAPTQDGGISLLLRGREHPLRPLEGSERSGWWSVLVEGARPGDRYAYLLKDGRRLPDPASRRQPEGVHGPSALWDPGGQRWRHPFAGVRRDALVFYELHVGTFTDEGTLDAAARRLSELADLGITCVELLPVQPFAGKRNWGYDGVSLFAVHEAYGGPEALQRFVDAAHGAGLAVALDVVFNHLGPEGNYLAAFGPYFTRRHRTPWGDGLDYDGPNAGPVRAFAVQAALQWVRDFHVDVLRLDAVHAILDDSPRHLVGEIRAAVEAFAQRSGRCIHVIAESDLEDRKVVDPPPRGWGCAAMWSDDFHHAVHAFLTGEREAFLADFGEMEHLVRALAAGFAYRGERSAFRGAPRGTGTAGLCPAQFVVSLQNHDQVGNRAWGERLSQLLPADALAPLATLLVLGSGLPLLFMGEEYGEPRPFLYFTSHGDPALARAVVEGRRKEHGVAQGFLEGREVPDPQDEATFQRSMLTHGAAGWHGALRAHYQAMLAVRRRHAALLGEHWPEVRADGARLALLRPGLEVSVNLSPTPSAELPAWGWRVLER